MTSKRTSHASDRRSPRTLAGAEPRDPNGIYPAQWQELIPVAIAALVLSVLALLVCASRGYLLLYGDAVAHLGIARRIFDARWPGLAQLGGVWLPLPHILMLPFIQKMEWWQNGMAGAWPSLACYIASVMGFNKLARHVLSEGWAFVATAFYALNPNLLYLATTAMTEPLFLALLLWCAVVVFEAVEAILNGKLGTASTRMVWTGVFVFLMVFTRYDGWIIGAAAWLILAVTFFRAPAQTRSVLLKPFVLCTVLCIAGPLLWFWYNARYEGDWLDFLRGPYSAAAIERKTSPPGAKHYRGWHNPGWALLFYTRTAQVDAAFWETGFALMLAALAGAWGLLRMRATRTIVWLLWLPLPFYIYSVAWGSVPIFIPQLYPHSYYNARYGMELLPALALCGIFPIVMLEEKLRASRPKLASWIQPVALLLAAANMALMVWSKPLVFQEGVVNAGTRIPFEVQLADQLKQYPAGTPIMMETNDHIGALQDAGIPLKQIISPLDSQGFNNALKDPAHSAKLIISLGDDAVAKAVRAHPQGLTELLLICHTGQPCARFYRSDVYQ